MKKGVASVASLPSRKRAKFISGLRTHGCVARAARESNLHRQNAYQMKAKHEEFSEEWDTALEECWDEMEIEARRRGVEGVPEGQYFKGKKIDEVTKYSDNLLMFVLKAKRPEFRDRTAHEISGPEGKSLNLTFSQLVGSAEDDKS